MYDAAGNWTGSVTVDVRNHYCKTCGRVATLQCDYPTRTRAGKARTCDAWICQGCATEVGPDRHHCPPHQRQHEAWAAKADEQLRLALPGAPGINSEAAQAVETKGQNHDEE